MTRYDLIATGPDDLTDLIHALAIDHQANIHNIARTPDTHGTRWTLTLSGIRNTHAHNLATNRGFLAHIHHTTQQETPA
jgi:hypothetical protein